MNQASMPSSTKYVTSQDGALPVATIHGSAPVYAAISDAPTLANSLFKSKQELGKLRRKHITITKQKLACGHAFAVGEMPRNNCDACWLTHFRTIPGISWTDTATGKPFDGLSPEVDTQVTTARGEKYAKRLRWFLKVNATLHTVRPELVAQ